ncbi:MAG: Holliday junction branch migration protein RuvA [Paenibacillaceae bacterium]
MIDYLRGQIRLCETDFIVMDVGGVGYRVFCANPYAYQQQSDIEAIVYIHYHVREDAILLYGFTSREEQALFRRLLEVTGIGPRVALGVLSGGRPELLIAAIQREDITYLTRMPGIGKKTAQRIILDLKDKLVPAGPALHDVFSFGGSSTVGSTSLSGEVVVIQEAKEALRALSFTDGEIDRIWPAVKAKMNENDSADTLIKMALQLLYKG